MRAMLWNTKSMFQVQLIADYNYADYPRGNNFVLIYSRFMHNRIEAERLATLWQQCGKPPMGDTVSIYADQYDDVPNVYTNIKTTIIDTKSDECCYNGDEPQYRSYYDADAKALVERYELDDPNGRWKNPSSVPVYVPLPPVQFPPLELKLEEGMFGWTARGHSRYVLYFAFPGQPLFFATEALAKIARKTFLNGREEDQTVLAEVADFVEVKAQIATPEQLAEFGITI